MDTLDEDLLEALAAEVPEYSWEEQDNAPIPRVAPPLAFTLQRARSRASASRNVLNESGDSALHGGTGTSRGVRKAAMRANKVEQAWDGDIFPFGYELQYPVPALTPLQTLRPGDNSPRSDIIVSPYMRIPPYTYCPRTSINWRRPTLSLHKRCHMTFLPFFGEEGYEDESHFRDLLHNEARSNGIKVQFTIPSEREQPSHGDEEDMFSKMPKDTVCGICLSVGCIIHREHRQSLGEIRCVQF
jgi:hypothetical protein